MKSPTQVLSEQLGESMKLFSDKWAKFGMKEQFKGELFVLLLQALQAGRTVVVMEELKKEGAHAG